MKSDQTDTLRIKVRVKSLFLERQPHKLINTNSPFAAVEQITELETKLSSNSLSEIEKDKINFELDTCLVDINNHSAEIDNLIIGIKQLGNDIVAINQRLDVQLKGIYEVRIGINLKQETINKRQLPILTY